MNDNSEEYKRLTKEVSLFSDRINKFNKKFLIAKGYPLWVINSEEEYLKQTFNSLKLSIEQYKTNKDINVPKNIINQQPIKPKFKKRKFKKDK